MTASSAPSHAENITCPPPALSRACRFDALGHAGATVWFTGLPGSGKSTIAAAVEETLVRAGRSAYRLDGDQLRTGLNRDLGFDLDSRVENVRRTAEVAKLCADAGTIALVSLVSPYSAGRAHARALHEQDGLPFAEVWVSTSLAECERRDPKGLYARARRGDLLGMTGIDDPYEAPDAPDLEVCAGMDLVASALCVMELINSICAARAPT